MAATCLASVEAAKTAAAAAGAEVGRASWRGSGLGTIAIEEVVLSASSRNSERTLPVQLLPAWELLLLLLFFLPLRHLRGLVPFGWLRWWWPRRFLLHWPVPRPSWVTIHDSSRSARVTSGPSDESSDTSNNGKQMDLSFACWQWCKWRATYLVSQPGPSLHLQQPGRRCCWWWRMHRPVGLSVPWQPPLIRHPWRLLRIDNSSNGSTFFFKKRFFFFFFFSLTVSLWRNPLGNKRTAINFYKSARKTKTRLSMWTQGKAACGRSKQGLWRRCKHLRRLATFLLGLALSGGSTISRAAQPVRERWRKKRNAQRTSFIFGAKTPFFFSSSPSPSCKTRNFLKLDSVA